MVPGLPWKYGETLRDGEEFRSRRIEGRCTPHPGSFPGRAPATSSYDRESGDHPVIVFSGDTLFVGDVGRTDFLGLDKTAMMSGNSTIALLGNCSPLGTGWWSCPPTGYGSVCGGTIREREISTIGAERAMNPMLGLTRDEFIERKVGEKHETPPYFSVMKRYNLEGRRSRCTCLCLPHSPPLGSGRRRPAAFPSSTREPLRLEGRTSMAGPPPRP